MRFSSLILLLFILFFVPEAGVSQDCSSDGNVAIFSNYDGGFLIIDVNQNIPNLKIGICSYEPSDVFFTGAFVGNITEVIFAGYHPLTGTGNFHCDNNLAVTTVSNPPNASVQILDYPPVTLLTDEVPIFPGSTVTVPIGNNNGILGCYSCNNTDYQGGANTSDQLIDYFLTEFGGELLFIKTQYGCWCGTQNLDQPASCCFEINPVANVTINADPSLSICDGEEVTLDAGPGYNSYNWSTGDNSQTIVVNAAGTYSVNVNSNCGSASDQVVVTLADSPEISLDVFPQYDCVDGQLLATVLNPADSPGPYAYTFQDASGTTVASVGNLATGLNAGFYTVTVESLPTGCVTTQTIEVQNAGQAFTVDIETTAVGCDNAATGTLTINFTAFLTDDYTFTLFDVDNVLIETGALDASISISDLAPGQYELQIDAAGTPCTYNSSVLLENEGPFLTASDIEELLCFEDHTGAITVEIEGGQPPYFLEWTNSSGDLLGSDFSLENLTGGMYFLYVEDTQGCSAEYDFFVQSPLPLSLNAEKIDLSCTDAQGGSILLSAGGGQAPYLYSIDGVTFQSDSAFAGNSAGFYTPGIQDANGCLLEGQELELVEAAGLAVSILASANDLSTGDPFFLDALVAPPFTEPLNYNWTPILGLDCTNCPSPKGTAIENTLYIVDVVDSLGCTGRAEVLVEVTRDLRLYLPTAFSPNEDGVNDFYKVFPGKSVRQILALQIFDRWGGLAYDLKQDPTQKGWDGRIGGQPAEQGVYTVLVEVEFLTGDREVLGKSLVLVR
ncbi:MAG: gliding motility-associated C-terminal domain-containing protein [Saprospiraceae bacterium]|nr:gliding motility-associated C-terminal domain-containing protein [Saprospiraceae bacterium]